MDETTTAQCEQNNSSQSFRFCGYNIIRFILYFKKMTIFISEKYQRQHLAFLTNARALYQLFDKLQLRSIFSIAENCMVVDLDNITFGPDRYAITITDPYHVYHRTIYYCVLYLIFERDHSASLQAYEKLVQYIIESKLEFELNTLPLSEEQAKVYLLKFLNLLWGSRLRHKLIVQELKNLPQIDSLLLQLFVKVTGVGKFDIESNAGVIQQNLKKHLAMTFEFLSEELILLQQGYQVEVRQFSECSQFDISLLTADRVEEIRREFELMHSACFRGGGDEFDNQQIWGKKTIPLMKKQTTQSIQLQEDAEQWEEEQQFAQFEAVFRDDLFDRFPLIQIGFKKPLGKVCEVATDNESNGCMSNNITHSLSAAQIIKKESSESDPSTIGGEVLTEAKKEETVAGEWHLELQNEDRCRRLQKNKTQTCLLPSLPAASKMNNSMSPKYIKSEYGDGKPKFRKERRPRRVPSFIVDRMNAKHDSCQMLTQESAPQIGKQCNQHGIKITFNYCSR